MTRLKTFILFLFLYSASIVALSGQVFNQTQKILDPNGSLGLVGASVALSGNYAILGSPMADAPISPATNGVGKVDFFERSSSGEWVGTQEIFNPSPDELDMYGSSVAIWGEWAAVGVEYEENDANGMNPFTEAGLVYIYKRDMSGDWNLAQTMERPDRMVGDSHFGSGLAFSDGYLAVGAIKGDVDFGPNFYHNIGAVYLFDLDSLGSWNFSQKIGPPDIEGFGYGAAFGNSFSLKDNRLTIGSPYSFQDTLEYERIGTAYIYERDTMGQYSYDGKLAPSFPLEDDEFGFAVSVLGDIAVASAPQKYVVRNVTDTIYNAGVIYTYFRDSLGNWNRVDSMASPLLGEIDRFGEELILFENYLLVGQIGDSLEICGSNSNLVGSGIFLYEANLLGGWNLVQQIRPADALKLDVGRAIAVDTSGILVGVPGNTTDETGSNSVPERGAGYFFASLCSNGNVEIGVTAADPILTSQASGASYQWINCDKCNAPVPGATEQAFSAPGNGNYAVIVIENGCVDTSACFTVTTVGFSESLSHEHIKVFPNPVSEQLTIDLGPIKKPGLVKIYNSLGVVVEQGVVDPGNPLQLDWDNVPGFYFAEIIVNGKSSKVFKIVGR